MSVLMSSQLSADSYTNEEERIALHQYAIEVAEEELRLSLKEGLVEEIENVVKQVIDESESSHQKSIADTSPDVATVENEPDPEKSQTEEKETTDVFSIDEKCPKEPSATIDLNQEPPLVDDDTVFDETAPRADKKEEIVQESSVQDDEAQEESILPSPTVDVPAEARPDTVVADDTMPAVEKEEAENEEAGSHDLDDQKFSAMNDSTSREKEDAFVDEDETRPEIAVEEDRSDALSKDSAKMQKDDEDTPAITEGYPVDDCIENVSAVEKDETVAMKAEDICQETSQALSDESIKKKEEAGDKSIELGEENEELVEARRRREAFLARLETENSAEMIEERIAAARAREIQKVEASAAAASARRDTRTVLSQKEAAVSQKEEPDLFISIPNTAKEDDLSGALFGAAQEEPLFGEAQVDGGALFGDKAEIEETLFGESDTTIAKEDIVEKTSQTTKIDHPLFGEDPDSGEPDLFGTNPIQEPETSRPVPEAELDLFGNSFQPETSRPAREAELDLFGSLTTTTTAPADTSQPRPENDLDLFGAISTTAPPDDNNDDDLDLFGTMKSTDDATSHIRQNDDIDLFGTGQINQTARPNTTTRSMHDDPFIFSDTYVHRVTPNRDTPSYVPRQAATNDNPFSVAAARARTPHLLQEPAVLQEEKDDVFAPPPVGAKAKIPDPVINDPNAEWRVTRNDLALHRHELGKAAATYAFGGVFSCSMYGTAEAKDFETGEPYTEYIIRCQFGKTFETMKPWMVARRFREFVAVDANLRAALPDLAPHLPPLPSSFVFFAMSPQIVEQRQQGLEHYLKTLITEFPATLKSPQLDEFLCIRSRIAATTTPRAATSNAALNNRGGFI